MTAHWRRWSDVRRSATYYYVPGCRAKSGEGRVVLLSGEPGIGKSRLLVELEAWLATETHGSLRYFCSPLHQGSALHPIIARWEQEAGFARGDTDEQRLCKLESVLAPDELSPTDVALIAGSAGVSAASVTNSLTSVLRGARNGPSPCCNAGSHALPKGSRC